MRPITCALALPLLVCGCQTTTRTATPVTPEPVVRTRLDVRINPLVDLHYLVRRSIDTPAEMPQIAGFAEAVDAARAVQTKLGSPLYWGFLEGILAEQQTVAGLTEAFGLLPVTKQLRTGRTVPLREIALRYAEALVSVESPFGETVWPQHQAILATAAQRLADVLAPREAECLHYIMQHIGMTDPLDAIPVYLVSTAPFPGGFTHRRRGGGGVCFVSVENHGDALLCEIVLHETLHALEVATEGQPTALRQLRLQLREAGLGPNDRALRDVPHTVIFVQAAETVRRLLDPTHQHYGEICGYYAKVPAAVHAVIPAWQAYLDGKLSRSQAVERIVAEATSVPKDE